VNRQQSTELPLTVPDYSPIRAGCKLRNRSGGSIFPSPLPREPLLEGMNESNAEGPRGPGEGLPRGPAEDAPAHLRNIVPIIDH